MTTLRRVAGRRVLWVVRIPRRTQFLFGDVTDLALVVSLSWPHLRWLRVLPGQRAFVPLTPRAA